MCQSDVSVIECTFCPNFVFPNDVYSVQSLSPELLFRLAYYGSQSLTALFFSLSLPVSMYALYVMRESMKAGFSMKLFQVLLKRATVAPSTTR